MIQYLNTGHNVRKGFRGIAYWKVISVASKIPNILESQIMVNHAQGVS